MFALLCLMAAYLGRMCFRIRAHLALVAALTAEGDASDDEEGYGGLRGDFSDVRVVDRSD